MKTLLLNGRGLNIDLVYQVAFEKNFEIKICPKAKEKMQQSRQFVLDVANGDKPVYGINTGFGALANKKIPKEKLSELQYNLIRSHCTGVGDFFAPGVVRAIMLLRANCLTTGHSGVNPALVELLLSFLAHDIIPLIPKKGSVGASGDLAPLSHLCLCLIGEGKVLYQSQHRVSKEVMDELKLPLATLGPKDGLAMINGTAVMTALGALAIFEGKLMAKLSDINACMTLEGARGSIAAFDPDISQLKPHSGQLKTCQNLNLLCGHSEINSSHEHCDKVQDPYSLRCAPQVHGACRQAITHAEEIITTEINSVTDNPLIFWEQNKVVSGGNFHGEALALCMDYAAMGLAELANICERRIEKLINPVFSDLPHFLTQDSGLNSGLMIAHVTVAALVSENKILCHPASVDSIPTSTDKEDHVSMGVTSGNKLHEVLRNLKSCLAVELLCNTQAIDLLRPLKSTPVIEAVHQLIRQTVPPITQDRVFGDDILAITKLINSGEIVETVEKIVGELQ